jgi:hypothetical protein
MDSFSIYISAVSLIISAFLVLISSRAYKRIRSNIFLSMTLVFAIVLADSSLFILSTFNIIALPFDSQDMLLFSNLLILIVFYAGAIRRTS